MMRAAIILLAMLGAGGCMPTVQEEEIPPRSDPRFTCNAQPVQHMVGQIGTRELAIEAVRASGARTMRWIRPGEVYTMDYREDRLNIHIDAQNRVTRIVCG